MIIKKFLANIDMINLENTSFSVYIDTYIEENNVIIGKIQRVRKAFNSENIQELQQFLDENNIIDNKEQILLIAQSIINE